MRLWGRKSNGESHEAVEQAETHLDEARKRNPEVYEVAGSLRRFREHNHFAEQIYLIMDGGGHTGGRSS